MSIELPHLEYSHDALEPHISSATLKAHHGKHHRAYVDKTNALIAGTPLADASLEAIVRHAAQRRAHESAMTKLFNQAAQAWSHAFYWQSLRAPSRSKPQGALGDAIRGTFGSQPQFEEAFKTAGVEQFGSGWVWLVLDGHTLRITTTGNADTPIVHGQRPLLAIDVWEHAYYLDYHEKRPEHLAAVIGHLLNWDFAMRNLEAL
ncbi:MAG TPA: superoxide dismutase [Burkholderiaceae bacterium]|nr:superoxide dismutase [Burkholderiaceae bacterium]